MKIYLGSDHSGYKYKEELKTYLSEVFLEAEIVDKGNTILDTEDDYPDFITPVAEAVAGDEESFGIVLGGSGQGEAMCANRVEGARALVFYGEEIPEGEVDIIGRKSIDTFEIIKLGREHNNANILSIGARFVTLDEAKFACELFLKTPFSKDERHMRRLAKF
ncbi:MAG: RpiB/LacA/LacB family sugar-phosphate isomerase [Candidatus Pacebacteria bacterium]|nr:RpiB/LacA/LacB family sugar-phosphate isomerase [Candidatus Paceibacterota bacterium]